MKMNPISVLNLERTSNAIGRFFVSGKNVIQILHPSFDLVVYMQSMQNIQNMQKMQNMHIGLSNKCLGP